MIWSRDAALARAATWLPAVAVALALAVPSLTWGADTAARPGAVERACPGWEAFKSRFIQPDGRVIDTANGGISHSEGQGYALILAVAHGDAGTFARVYGWTRRHLMLRADGLLVWKWSPDPAARYPDTNSASDGDLLVAHGLLLAGARFDTPRYTEAAEHLAEAVKRHLIRDVGPYTVLLPGPAGFTRPDGSVVINPSYWLFPTLELLAQHTGQPVWRKLDASGRDLLRTGGFGAWDLPPDWLHLTAEGEKRLTEPDLFAPVFGYNAMRVPLYLAWADAPADADVMDRFRRFWTAQASEEGLPLVWDLGADTARERGHNLGVRAIRDLVSADAEADAVPAPNLSAGTHYYDAVLALLACLADKGDSPCACAA